MYWASDSESPECVAKAPNRSGRSIEVIVACNHDVLQSTRRTTDGLTQARRPETSIQLTGPTRSRGAAAPCTRILRITPALLLVCAESVNLRRTVSDLLPLVECS
jgi:hypothetical protein